MDINGKINDLVSIIMPTYKRHSLLVERAVLSVLTQTYGNIELVLVDDNAGEKLVSYRQEVEDLVKKLNSDNKNSQTTQDRVIWLFLYLKRVSYLITEK